MDRDLTEREQTIWLAALLEGEGTFLAEKHPRGRPRLRVGLGMTDRDVVERAAEISGFVGTISMVYRDREGWQTQHRIAWCSQAAEDLMRRVLPFMGQRRKAKIEECLALDLSHHAREQYRRTPIPGYPRSVRLWEEFIAA